MKSEQQNCPFRVEKRLCRFVLPALNNGLVDTPQWIGLVCTWEEPPWIGHLIDGTRATYEHDYVVTGH